MTIEHIAPQSLIGHKDFSDQNIGQIGNLILVSHEINQKLKDKNYTSKKAILKEFGFNLDSDLDKATNWDVEEISNRTRVLADKAYHLVWKL